MAHPATGLGGALHCSAAATTKTQVRAADKQQGEGGPAQESENTNPCKEGPKAPHPERLLRSGVQARKKVQWCAPSGASRAGKSCRQEITKPVWQTRGVESLLEPQELLLRPALHLVGAKLAAGSQACSGLSAARRPSSQWAVNSRKEAAVGVNLSQRLQVAAGALVRTGLPTAVGGLWVQGSGAPGRG